MTAPVDTVGFNEGSWIEAVDDPAAYQRTWTGGFNLRWNLGAELFEYVCQENNLVETTNDGADGAIRRTSLIIP